MDIDGFGGILGLRGIWDGYQQIWEDSGIKRDKKWFVMHIDGFGGI